MMSDVVINTGKHMSKKIASAKKKVLFFTQANVGGAERMTVNIAKMLPRDEYDVVFCLISLWNHKSGKSTIRDFIPDSMQISEIQIENRFDYLRKLYKKMRETKPDYVFCSTMPNNRRILMLSPLIRKCKFIVRNDNYLFTLPRYKKLAISLSYRLADRIVAQTEEMGEEFAAVGIDRKKICVLHNPVETEIIRQKATEYNPYEDYRDTVNYAAVGRFAHQKGYDLLVRAFADVLKSNENSELWIVGDDRSDGGQIRNDIENYGCSMGFLDKIHFVGYTPNPYPYIANADCFVLSSRYEGLPNVLVESLTLGTPAAAFGCIPIIGRIINEGVNGFVAKPEDPESLAKAMADASQLGKIKSGYHPARKEQFIELFR